MAAATRGLPAGAYTTFRTYDGRRVLRLDQHLRRLEDSAALQGQPGAIDASAARTGLRSVIGAATSGESRLRLTFAPPRLFVSIEPFAPPDPAKGRAGVSCVKVAVRRENPHAKDTRFVATAQDAYATLPPGVEEGLMVAEDGAILEGLSSNFFAVREGTLFTEGPRVLEGVTRAVVLEVAALVLPVKLQPVLVGDLPRIDEAFVTSVSREVLPVVRIDGRDVGLGRPGPFTRRIQDGFARLVEVEAEAV